MHSGPESGGSDQTMNILVYIPTHHSELEKKKNRSVKVVTTIWITINFSITIHIYSLAKLENNIQLSFNNQPLYE